LLACRPGGCLAHDTGDVGGQFQPVHPRDPPVRVRSDGKLRNQLGQGVHTIVGITVALRHKQLQMAGIWES
jgi:hypothetical protein